MCSGVAPFIHSDVNERRHVDFAIHFDDVFTGADDDFLLRSDSDDDEFLVIIGHLELPSGAVFTTLLSRCNGYTDVSYPGIGHRRACATCRLAPPCKFNANAGYVKELYYKGNR